MPAPQPQCARKPGTTEQEESGKGDSTMSESKKKKQKQENAEAPEKVVTRYDLKMQKRQEQKKKEEREKKISAVVGILLVVGLACLVASFPIRSYLTVHGTYITVDGEKVPRVEFDYNYNLVMNSYMSQNYYYLSMFGLDLSGDLSQQMYSETLTWKDFFEQMAVDNIKRTKALKREMMASADVFTYDPTEDYEEYKKALQDAAAESGSTLKAYVQEMFGPYATMSRVEDYVKEGMITSAYYESVRESRTPSDEEIQEYYDQNKNDYDSVDYRMTVVNAELPTEPTELADPVEESESAESGDTEAADGEEAAYEPSEAEIEAAMSEAKKTADEKEKTIGTQGELFENQTRTSVQVLLREWLFDSSRKAKDTTVIEDTGSHCYYVLEFEDRYLD